MFLKKIFIIFIFSFLFICIYIIPMIQEKQTLRANVFLEEVTGITNQTIYLQDKNGYLVEVDVFLDPSEEGYPIKSIFSYLKTSNTEMDASFHGYIPDSISLLDFEVIDSVLYLNFSHEFLEVADLDLMISGIVHSYFDIKDLRGISIKVDGNSLDGYPMVFDKDYVINAEESFIHRKDIEKVVVYYIDSFDKDYYLPVTKYLNDKREKIEIIVEELKSHVPNHLVSYLSEKTKLIDYSFENNMMILNLNFQDFDKKEEIYQMLAKSVASNYDVSGIVIKDKGKIDKIISFS